MTDVAKTVVSIILGFIAGVITYPYLDNYMIGLIAFLGSLAVGFLVYVGVRSALAPVGRRY